MKLSVIDQSPVPAGFTPADALRNTLELARLADRLGYTRYWIAEHHAIPALASPAPEVLIARVAAETRGIRVGSGGVMLPHYSPYKVAECFRVLHALYPDRIDLGIGRAPGGTPLDSFALWRDRDHYPPPDDFGRQLPELLAFLNHGFPANHPFSQITVTPDMPGTPEVWLLGSSMWSASAAAQLGLPYAFAHFIEPGPTRAAIAHYQANFQASRSTMRVPRTILALGAVCAETDAEAERLLASVRLFRRRIRQNDVRPIPTVEEALRELGETSPLPSEQVEREDGIPRYVVGSPERVRDQLSLIAEELRVQEVMVVTIVHDHRARLRSYELMAAACGLEPRA
ncbi:MAG TPA: LLM class flavin-dependent oxidoreductase [Candidatus Binataceae bacterium]|nr:LLM class flavin-dependent oxidoreductase [Candidatus Binataceae bacterium]